MHSINVIDWWTLNTCKIAPFLSCPCKWQWSCDTVAFVDDDLPLYYTQAITTKIWNIHGQVDRVIDFESICDIPVLSGTLDSFMWRSFPGLSTLEKAGIVGVSPLLLQYWRNLKPYKTSKLACSLEMFPVYSSQNKWMIVIQVFLEI